MTVADSYRLRSLDAEARQQVHFYFNGRKVTGFVGEPIAAALLANGIKALRIDETTGEPRGVYCGIGHCFECRAEVDGKSSVRTCLTPVQEGTRVVSADASSGEAVDGDEG